MTRLDRVMSAKEIAQIGAALGRQFSYELISAVADRSVAELDIALKQLIEAGLLISRGGHPETVYAFNHDLVQDVAYDSLLKSRRRQLHGNIAGVMHARFPDIVDTEPEVLAHHLGKR